MWGRGPEISWQTSQKDLKIQNKRPSGWSLTLYILYTAVLSILLIYATAGMAAGQLDIRLGEEQKGCIWVIVLEILLILVWNEVMHALGKRRLRWVGNLVLLGIVGWGCYWYYHELADELTGGFGSLGQRYLDLWNHYFETRYRLRPRSVSGEPLAWGLLLIVVTALLQTVSALLRKRTIMLILPVAVLAAEMTVGVTPGWWELACMSGAGLLSLYLDFHRQFQAFPALLLAALLGLGLSMTALLLTEPASQINLLHEQLQAFQHQMENEIREYDWQALLHREGKVDNHSPQYEKKTVLTVEVNLAPNQTMYLRGYYGTDYRKGFWNTSDKEFGRVSLQHGLFGSRAAELLAELSSSAYSSLPEDKLHYELQYTGLRSSQAYLPYGADLDTAQSRYKLSGDYVVEKSRGLESFTFEGWDTAVLTRDGNDMPDYDAENFYLWYNDFVQTQYMGVAEDIPALTDMVNVMESHVECQSAQKRLEEEDIAVRNAARLYLGSFVSDWLQARASYSLEPGSLPRDMDPIEYFLGENRKGYCVHFATAGVLLLRRLGVPARYVSGYVARTSQFTRNGDGYVADVKDENAHAWAEIWLDNVGWVPVEMTPGYDSTGIELPLQGTQSAFQPQEDEILPKATDAPEMPSTENEESENSESSATPSPRPQELPEDSEEKNEAKNLPGAGAAGVSGSADGGKLQSDGEGWGFAGEGGWSVFGQNGKLHISHVVLALLGIMGVAWICHRAVPPMLRRRVGWQDKIKADIESGSTTKAVKLINRRLYRQLWRKRAGMLALRSDEEYLAALKQQYPQISGEEWEMYLSVVRKAVYSREDIFFQEALDCLTLLTHTRSS